MYEPSGTVYISPGNQQTFVPSQSCPGLAIAITPANGTAGFASGDECEDTYKATSGALGTFKVKGCEDGTVTVDVYDGATHLQAITVVVEFP